MQEIQEQVLFRSMFLSTSRANKFYKFLLTQYMKGAHTSKRNIVHRIRCTCDKYDIPFSEYICYGSYMKTIKHNLKKYPENEIADSFSFILMNPYEQSRSVINVVLSPF